MHVLQIVVILASLCSLCLTRRQALGSRCKGTGTCETKGTCPNDVIGKCCGGLDCCGCKEEERTCGRDNQGTCVAHGACVGTKVSGKCCDGLECCACSGVDTPCGSDNQGVCVAERTCSGSTIPGECCGGLECCENCTGVDTPCGSGNQGVCVAESTCSGSTISGECCGGLTCCDCEVSCGGELFGTCRAPNTTCTIYLPTGDKDCCQGFLCCRGGGK